MRKFNLFIKRFADVVGSFIGIAILSWLFIVIVISIKVTSKGPVFFLQERLGKFGKEYKIIKFRTMVVNAEKIGDGLKVKSDEDPRITKVGRFLRKTSLDELPQLLNVLIGNMSLIGPRPPVTYHPYNGYNNYPEWAQKRFEMRPGITGLAQATVRNSVSWDERIKVDNEYVDKFNIFLDAKIIFMTVGCLIKKKDIYAPRAGFKDQPVVREEALRK